MKRRHFLQQSTLLSLLASGFSPLLLPRLSFASDNGAHFFLLLRISGGWDTSLSLDPKTHREGTTQEDIFIEYQESDILRSPKGLLLGPAAASLKPFMDEMAVIKGIEMRRDAGHFTNLEMMSTGYGDGKTAALPIELSSTYRSGPMGVVFEQNLPVGQRINTLTNMNQIVNSNSNGETLDFTDLGDDGFGTAIGALSEINSLSGDISKISQKLISQGATNKQAALAAVFSTHAAFQASIDVTSSNLDSHSNHVGNHLNSQKRSWEEVANLFALFAKTEYKNSGQSLFDHTTFMVVSEFGRTPALNGAKGKDHNPHANSVLLAGRGIQGGTSVGKSFIQPARESSSGISMHLSRPIDYKTGTALNKGEGTHKDVGLIFPENVAASVASIFGNPEGFLENKHGKTQSTTIPGHLRKESDNSLKARALPGILKRA